MNVYTVEGSTINITSISSLFLEMEVSFNKKNIYFDGHFISGKTQKYDVVLHSDFLLENVTERDIGYYWLRPRIPELELELNITSKFLC